MTPPVTAECCLLTARRVHGAAQAEGAARFQWSVGFGGFQWVLVGCGGLWWVVVGFRPLVLVDVGLKTTAQEKLTTQPKKDRRPPGPWVFTSYV